MSENGNRLYPRVETELGGVVGEKRTAVVSLLDYLPELRDLEAQAVADLGGEANISALRRRTLTLGLRCEAVGLMLLREIEHKAMRATRLGKVPYLSRYKATAVAGYWLDQAARRYAQVGLNRVAKRADLAGYLEGRKGESTDPLSKQSVRTTEDQQ